MRTIRLNHIAGAMLALACISAGAQTAASRGNEQRNGGTGTQSSAMERARAMVMDAGRANAGQQAAAGPCAAQRMTVSHCVFDVPATPNGQGAAVMNKTVGFIGVIAAACTNGAFKVRDSLCDADAALNPNAQADIDAIVRNTDWSGTTGGAEQSGAGTGSGSGSANNASNNISGTALVTYSSAGASFSGTNNGGSVGYTGLSYSGQIGACERGGVYDPFRLIADASATDAMIASAIEKSYQGGFQPGSFQEVLARFSIYGISADRVRQAITNNIYVVNTVAPDGGFPHGWPTCDGSTPAGWDAGVHASMCAKHNGPGAAMPAAKWLCDTPAPGTSTAGAGSQGGQVAASDPGPVVCTEGVGQFATWSAGGNTCTSEVPGATNADSPARLPLRKAGGSVLMLQQLGPMRGDALYVCGADGKWSMTSAQCAPATGCQLEFKTDIRSENSTDTCAFKIDTRGNELANGATAPMTNSTPGTTGGATAMCRNGSFELVSAVCRASSSVAAR